jgi:hypothetical protein
MYDLRNNVAFILQKRLNTNDAIWFHCPKYSRFVPEHVFDDLVVGNQ